MTCLNVNLNKSLYCMSLRWPIIMHTITLVVYWIEVFSFAAWMTCRYVMHLGHPAILVISFLSRQLLCTENYMKYVSLFCSINLKLCSKQAVLLIITCIIDIFYEPQYLLDRIVAKSNSLGYFQSLCRASVGTWQLQIMSVWQASVLCCIADIDSFADAIIVFT